MLVPLSTSCRGGKGADPAERPERSSPAPAADPEATPAPKSAGAASIPKVDVPQLKTRFPAAPRVVAIGDVHGDLEATREVLRLAGAIDEQDTWVGGALVVVQTGDQLDRGDDELEILVLLDRLAEEAKAAGGAVHVLNGNHELMNAIGDFRYVTPEGFADYADAAAIDDPRLSSFPSQARGRAAAFLPGGPEARRLGQRNTVVIVGDTLFVHGGVEPQWARKIDDLNARARAYLMGAVEDPRNVVGDLMAPDGVVWSRAFSEPQVDEPTCARLGETLRLLGISRMVVGHTVQKDGITSACDDKVWRIDVGMAEHYGGSVQALQIEGGEVSVLRP